GVFFHRTSWDAGATASALKAGPPEGHRATRLLASIPEWQLSSGHAHPDAGSFIIWAGGRYLTGDTGYAGQPQARHHNTITVGGIGQGDEGAHDVWRNMSQPALDTIRITRATADATGVRVEADVAGAYPPAAGLARFHRVFTFDGKAAFTVEDTIETKAPKTIEWFLHADAPITAAAGAFLLGSAPAALRVRLDTPAGSKTSTGPTFLTAPGQPGSITSGKQEQRGYEIRVDVPAASAVDIKALLTLEVKR
ncbi:MAG TPA: heparinase II/III family protein, partial [Vicinamibacterales bacterium]|nr:heparinase II/III family protein [Vicinamibacterales bacterium]